MASIEIFALAQGLQRAGKPIFGWIVFHALSTLAN